jgi:CubicO group peptidase (beta-lactamase class C family)
MTRRTLLKQMLVCLGSDISARVTDAAGVTSSASSVVDERERAAMNRVADEFMATYAVPGLSVAIAWKGTLQYEQGFGVADRERGERVTGAHLFRIASASKPITSVAVFDLIERGRLKLTDHVFGRGGVLGDTYGHPPYGPHVEDVTIEHLLTHTAGGWQNDASDPMFANPEMSHAELISWALGARPLTHPPGTRYAYSNFGYCVLGRVIEKLSGKPYVDHVRQRILHRCGVDDMVIARNTPDERVAREVTYYGQGGEDPYGPNVRRMDSHGGWLASARDLTCFAMHVDGFTTTANILSPDTIRTMTSASTANSSYAKGWAVNRLNNWWHGGSLPGTTSIVVRTSGGFCWAALANSRRSGSEMGRAFDEMVWSMVRQVKAWRT